jgi:hypothetical protein
MTNTHIRKVRSLNKGRRAATLRVFVCVCHSSSRQHQFATRTQQFSNLLSHDVRVTDTEPGYNDIGLYNTSPIVSGVLWYQLIPHC